MRFSNPLLLDDFVEFEEALREATGYTASELTVSVTYPFYTDKSCVELLAPCTPPEQHRLQLGDLVTHHQYQYTLKGRGAVVYSYVYEIEDVMDYLNTKARTAKIDAVLDHLS